MPILLVDPDKKVLTDDQKTFLKSVKNDIIIIGGSGAVSETYEASIYVKNNDISGGIALGGTGALSDKTVRYAFRQSSSAMIKGERYQ